VASLDNPNNPQNFVAAYFTSTANVRLVKYVNGTLSVLANTVRTYVPGELLEIRKNVTTYQVFYGGTQVGLNQTISDVTVISNLFVGVISTYTSQFGAFSVRAYGLHYSVPNLLRYWSGSTYAAGQGVLSLRFDDGTTGDFATTYPLLVARNLVAGWAMYRTAINAAGHVTLAQLLTMQAAGHEIMCHSYTHGVDPASFAEFVTETLDASAEMRLLGLNEWSFVQPGSWVGSIYHIDNVNHFGLDPDVFLRICFDAYEAYAQPFDDIGGGSYFLPRSGRYGVQHITGDALTLLNLQALLADCIADGQGLETLFHSANIGGGGFISLADFTTFLDDVETAVITGDLVVLTPTQQLFAVPL
jgi:hypothetical protein